MHDIRAETKKYWSGWTLSIYAINIIIVVVVKDVFKNNQISGQFNDCQNISLYEPEQSLSLSQDEGELCWGVP